MTLNPAAPVTLVVDDDAVTRLLVRRSLERMGSAEVLQATDGRAAQAILRERSDIDLVVTDIQMPGMSGLDLLRWGREHSPGVTWIILSGMDTFDSAVEAIRLGAFDFLAKPPRMEQIDVAVGNALEHSRLVQERDRLHAELGEKNIELLAKVRELEEKSDLLRRDLQRAEVIQQALLPGVPPSIEGYSVHSLYRPGNYVGGDLYDVLRLDDRHIALYVADATGHGVTAAMLSVLYKQRLSLVDASTALPREPGEVLAAVNRALAEAIAAPGLFLTAVYCLVDTVEGTATIASAGHPPVLHLRAGRDTMLIRRTGPALGLTTEARFDEEQIRLEPDDRLLFYSDGLLQSGMEPESDTLHRLASMHPSNGGEMLRELHAEITRDGPVVDEAERDDLTLLVLDAREGPCGFDNGAGRRHDAGAGATLPRPGVLFYGESESASFIELRGRMIWTHCDAFLEAALAVLRTGRPLVLELATCEYLDSTSLGTIHELVGREGVRLQGVQPPVRALFEELSMERVLASIAVAIPAPELFPLVTAAVGADAGRLLLLRAHEVLAGLSDENREKFQAVVDALRGEEGGGN